LDSEPTENEQITLFDIDNKEEENHGE
jgi:hypothetical protein